MGGLLYRDFVAACKVKKFNIVWALVVVVALYIVLRVIFPGDAFANDPLSVNEMGMSSVDAIFAMVFLVVPVLLLAVTGYAVNNIIVMDEKNKVRTYILGMPVSKNKYIASKYIFVLIACYVTITVSYIMGSFCMAFSSGDKIQESVGAFLSIISMMVYFTVFYMSLDLPMLILYGKAKAQVIEYAILSILLFAAAAFVLFVDFDKINLVESVMKWWDNNTTLIAIIQVLAPVIVGGIFYLSYRTTCSVAARREFK